MAAPEETSHSQRPLHVSRANTKLVALTLITLAVLVLCGLLIWPFLPALVAATTLAVVTHRYWKWLSRHIARPSPRAAIAVATVAVALVVPVACLVYFSAAEIAESVRAWQDPDYQPPWQAQLAKYPRIEEAWNRMAESLDIPAVIRQTAGFLQSGTASILSGLAYAAVQSFLTLFVLFFLYRDEATVLEWTRRLSPLTDGETDQVLDRLRDTVLATIYGSVVVALVQGSLGGLIFFMLGLPGAVLWATAMCLLALVPYLGTFVVWAPAAVLLALQGDWVRAGILVGWGLCVIATIDNLLYPILVGNRLRQHTVISFFAIIGGITLLGATGIILGPVIVSLAFVLLDIWRQRTRELEGSVAG